MSRALVILTLFSLLAFTGCGGGGGESGTGAAPTATSIGIKVSPSSSITTSESGLATIISVNLGSQPTADVTIPISSSDTTEGSVNPSSLTFTSQNWASVQTFTVSGISDDINDGNQNYSIHIGPAKSADSSYNALEMSLPAVNLDVRKSSFIVTPTSGTTTENGGFFTFYVSLGYAPSADVLLPITGLPTEGILDKNELTFTTINWKTPQGVTVTGVSDTTPGDQTYSINLGPAQSTDTTYNNLVPPEVKVTNLNYKNGIVDVINISGNQTTEAGGQVTFQVQLHSKPAANVTIPVASSDTTEGIVSTNTLTFTPDNWNTPQTVTVTGVEDPIEDGTQSYTILLGLTSSTDDNYDGLDPADIGLTNLDVKTGTVEVTPLTLTTSEAGTQDSFKVRLGTKPFYDVTIPIKSLDTTEGTVDKDSLVFNSDNWNQFQIVTVTGVNDKLADGDVTYNIQLGPTSSEDDNYASLNPSAVTVTNLDVRVASFVVTPISGHTDEAGNTAYFDVSLGTPPSADVTIGVSSDNTGEGIVDKSSLTFTTTDWADPQRVTVTGVSDNVYDPAHGYNIILTADMSTTDPIYKGVKPPDVPVINDDYKKGVVSVSPITGNTDESGQQASVLVSLNYPPAANVTITVSSSNTAEGTVSPTTLTFTNATWKNLPVTVTGVADHIADGNQTYFINFSKTSSSDNNFNGLDVAPVSVVNVDLVDPYGVTPAISAGAYHNLVLASDGTVWGWGTCSSGELDAVSPATCSTGTYILPQRLNITRASAVSAGPSFSAIVKYDDGSVWTSGDNTSGQLGHASGSSLAQVSGLADIAIISAGAYHVLALKKSGAAVNPSTVWAWGSNSIGQLGTGTSGGSSQNPVQTTTPISGKTVTAIAAGGYHSLALDNTKTIYAWGSDGNGQLGLGANDQSTAIPTPISFSGASVIGAGQEYSFAVGTGGNGLGVYAWGLNDYGQLGINSTISQQSPAKVSTITSSTTRIGGGRAHSIALSGTTVYSWGDNDDKSSTGADKYDTRGALGSGSINDSISPVQTFIAGGTAMDVSAGFSHSLVIFSSDGRLQTSGLNDVAQLGTNEITSGLDQYTATPTYVEDPGDSGKGSLSYFYAYRPILSGQPATETTINSATITVCAAAVSAYCKNIAYYDYSTDGIFWHDLASVTTSPTISLTNLPLGTVTLYVRGYTSTYSPLQTTASAAKVSWKVVSP